ncbi:hypothetical protein [Janthinobacterium sp. PC23-8]|uniref:hypothetical protein n=1 Tax=Janthinobacterium sp. PC23-8 TaxID=2012679 RepID=UPI0015961397|nr:hypothetical protein [Janthinobacterium sp. PC23-8]
MENIDFSLYLPLSEATFYVLVCLREPLHGYAIMQKVDALSEGSVVDVAGASRSSMARRRKFSRMRLRKCASLLSSKNSAQQNHGKTDGTDGQTDHADHCHGMFRLNKLIF